MRSFEQRFAERVFSADEEKKDENAAEKDLNKTDAQESPETTGDKQSSTQNSEIKAQNRLDSIGDGGQDEKPDDYNKQSYETSENLREIRRSSPEYREMQQADAAQARLDGITDDSVSDDNSSDDDIADD